MPACASVVCSGAFCHTVFCVTSSDGGDFCEGCGLLGQAHIRAYTALIQWHVIHNLDFWEDAKICGNAEINWSLVEMSWSFFWAPHAISFCVDYQLNRVLIVVVTFWQFSSFLAFLILSVFISILCVLGNCINHNKLQQTCSVVFVHVWFRFMAAIKQIQKLTLYNQIIFKMPWYPHTNLW